MKLLEASQLTVQYGTKTVVDHVSFSLEEGQWLMLIGPNGAGKSTVVSAISQGAPYTGSVLIGGTDAKSMKARDLARNVGVLSQNHHVGYSFSVAEVVRLGRYCHAPSLFGGISEHDLQAVHQAMEMTGVAQLASHSVLTLSGGELQRTFLAQLFAQSPTILILDEPTNHLDLIYQKQVFSLIQTWLETHGGAVISVVHDLSLARAYGTHALLMNQGKTVAWGPTEQVFMPSNLNDAYGMDVSRWMQEMLRQWT